MEPKNLAKQKPLVDAIVALLNRPTTASRRRFQAELVCLLDQLLDGQGPGSAVPEVGRIPVQIPVEYGHEEVTI
jgi:hypothetical protein